MNFFGDVDDHRESNHTRPNFLDCYWVGSLDFNFLGNQGVSTKPQKVKLFAGGSTATTAASLGQATWPMIRIRSYPARAPAETVNARVRFVGTSLIFLNAQFLWADHANSGNKDGVWLFGGWIVLVKSILISRIPHSLKNIALHLTGIWVPSKQVLPSSPPPPPPPRPTTGAMLVRGRLHSHECQTACPSSRDSLHPQESNVDP